MAKFNFADYEKFSQTPTNRTVNRKFSDVRFFKLGNGESALVRINLKSTDEFYLCTVHYVGKGKNFRVISCLRPRDSEDVSLCPFCEAVAQGNNSIEKTTGRLFLEMNVKYADKNTGEFSNEVSHVLWSIPANTGIKKLGSMFSDYGVLADHVFKLTRIGEGTQTEYNFSYLPVVDNPQVLTNDFSAFKDYQIDRHGYLEKTADEMKYYLANGEFPASAGRAATSQVKPTATEVKATPVEQPVEKPVEKPVETSTPAEGTFRNFTQFKF